MDASPGWLKGSNSRSGSSEPVDYDPGEPVELPSIRFVDWLFVGVLVGAWLWGVACGVLIMWLFF